MARVGWWNKKAYPSHVYRRRQVRKDVKRFVGWEALAQLIQKIEGFQTTRNRCLVATGFATGGRIMEVLPLQRRHFTIDKDAGELVVQNMPLLKRYEKTGSWREYVKERPDNKLARLYSWDEKKEQWGRNRYDTKTLEEVRPDFSIPLDEPFIPLVLSRLETCRDSLAYLFPGYSQSHLSYQRAYQIISELGIYPHWLRAQRASCLVSFYRMSMEQMMEWMAWEELTTARHYARHGIRSLADKMKGKAYPATAFI